MSWSASLQEHITTLQDEPMGLVWYALILAVSVPCCLPSPPFEIIGGCAHAHARSQPTQTYAPTDDWQRTS